MNRLEMIAGIAALTLATGCSSYTASGSARAPLPLPVEVQKYYESTTNEVTATVTTIERHPTYSVKDVTLSIAGTREPIHIEWFTPNTPGHPLILLSPIRGSDTLVVDSCARAFVGDGYYAAIVKRAHPKFIANGPLSQVEDSLRDAVIRHREALDWLVAQPGVNPDRIGAFGVSYGGIITAVLAAVDPRVKFSVIDLAGGPLAGVMRSSEEASLRRSWSRSRESHDLTSQELYDELTKVIRTDPVKLAPYVARDRVLMLIARFDSSVPTRYQMKLWHALGKPCADFVPLGHYTSILALPAHRLNVMHFFEDNLDQSSAATMPAAVQAKN